MNKKVIVRVDGGICSQLYQYIIGQHYKERGFIVYYDLSWFYFDGKDLLGKRTRRFYLNKLIPGIKINRACIIRSIYFKIKYSYTPQKILSLPELHENTYLGGYYTIPPELYGKLFSLEIGPVIDKENMQMKNRIIQDDRAVAIHIRRGDMSLSMEGAYWEDVSPDYFSKAIDQFPEGSFYFFSDDLEWVNEHIIKTGLMDGKDFSIVNINDESKGYLDLYLLSLFSRWICSEGSLGMYGCLFSRQPRKIVVVPENSSWGKSHLTDIFDNIEKRSL